MRVGLCAVIFAHMISGSNNPVGKLAVVTTRQTRTKAEDRRREEEGEWGKGVAQD